MNCRDVETIVAGLARGEANQAAAAHIAGCPRCRERLAEEQRLTAGLRAWAESSESEEAPAALEAKLVAEFRRNAAPARQAVRRKWLLPLAAAAAALVAFRALLPDRPEPKPADAPAQAAAAVSTAPVIEPRPERPTPRVRRGRPAPPARIAPPAPRAEPEFLPVRQGDRWTPLDGGKLVRVGLPRAALRQFGLPMLEERAQEQVQADVILSNDGLVRAIRFVP